MRRRTRRTSGNYRWHRTAFTHLPLSLANARQCFPLSLLLPATLALLVVVLVLFVFRLPPLVLLRARQACHRLQLHPGLLLLDSPDEVQRVQQHARPVRLLLVVPMVLLLLLLLLVLHVLCCMHGLL